MFSQKESLSVQTSANLLYGLDAKNTPNKMKIKESTISSTQLEYGSWIRKPAFIPSTLMSPREMFAWPLKTTTSQRSSSTKPFHSPKNLSMTSQECVNGIKSIRSWPLSTCLTGSTQDQLCQWMFVSRSLLLLLLVRRIRVYVFGIIIMLMIVGRGKGVCRGRRCVNSKNNLKKKKA